MPETAAETASDVINSASPYTPDEVEKRIKELILKETSERNEFEQNENATREKIMLKRIWDPIALVFQRYIRGGLDRQKVFRAALEQSRSQLELQKELECRKQRERARRVDTVRLFVERQWVSFLNKVDEDSQREKREIERINKKISLQSRVVFRELYRKEQQERAELEEGFLRELKVFAIRLDGLLKRRLETLKKAQELKKAMENHGNHRGAPFAAKPHPVSVASRSAKSDNQARESLADYAIRRAMAFDQYYSSQLAPPNVANASTPGRHAIGSPLNSTGRSLFERSRARWARNEEYLDSRLAVDAPFHLDPSYDTSYSGSYLTEPSQAARATFSGSTYTPASQQPTNESPQPSAVMNKQLEIQYDWHQIFKK